MTTDRAIQLSQTDDGRCRLTLRGAIDVNLAETLLDESLRCVELRSDLRVDCRELTEIDAAALQVLVALLRAQQSQQRAFALESVCDNVLSTLRLTGLAETLVVKAAC